MRSVIKHLLQLSIKYQTDNLLRLVCACVNRQACGGGADVDGSKSQCEGGKLKRTSLEVEFYVRIIREDQDLVTQFGSRKPINQAIEIAVTLRLGMLKDPRKTPDSIELELSSGSVQPSS